jgi:hypothetical protein
MPVNQNANIQFRTLTLGVIERLQNSFAAIILLQIERNNANTLGGVAIFASNACRKSAGA